MSAAQNLTVNWTNVPTRTITAGGVEFAYRELGTNNPRMPVVFLIAGMGWGAWRQGEIARMSGRARAAAAAIAAVLLVILMPSFRLNLEHPAFGLRDTGGPPSADAPSP